MSLETVRVRNRHADDGIDVTGGAATPVPGLYVVRSEYGWPIVHVRSGLLVGTYEDPEAALACAIDLGPLWDWTQAAAGLRLLPRELKDEIVSTCRRWGALKGERPDTWDDL
jgi:hypothetical protein